MPLPQHMCAAQALDLLKNSTRAQIPWPHLRCLGQSPEANVLPSHQPGYLLYFCATTAYIEKG